MKTEKKKKKNTNKRSIFCKCVLLFCVICGAFRGNRCIFIRINRVHQPWQFFAPLPSIPKKLSEFTRISDECHICNKNRIFLRAGRDGRDRGTYVLPQAPETMHLRFYRTAWGRMPIEQSAWNVLGRAWNFILLNLKWLNRDSELYSINRRYVIRFDFVVIVGTSSSASKYCIRKKYHEFPTKNFPYENGSYANFTGENRWHTCCEIAILYSNGAKVSSTMNDTTNLHLSDVWR